MNIAVFSGLIVKDPYYQVRDRKNGEGQYSQACYTVVNRERNRDGKITENHFDVDVFDEMAKVAKDYLHQGSPVTLRGVLKSNSYTTRRGETVNQFGFVAYEQDSPDIPDKEMSSNLGGPEASQELPERSDSGATDDYEDQDYFQ